ncbi:MAG TPA: hypothetical protein VEP91_11560 [Solirubrobacterales bacterium]|nr:hypothetical protein [Solirubrobacterales bacterium]
MPAGPSPDRLSNRTAAFVGSTPAEGPKAAETNGVQSPGAGSLQAAREDRDAATGYADLRAEVEALEAAVDADTGEDVKGEIVALRNKIERPPLLEGFSSNSTNSVEVQRENVERVRAVARDLAERV